MVVTKRGGIDNSGSSVNKSLERLQLNRKIRRYGKKKRVVEDIPMDTYNVLQNIPQAELNDATIIPIADGTKVSTMQFMEYLASASGQSMEVIHAVITKMPGVLKELLNSGKNVVVVKGIGTFMRRDLDGRSQHMPNLGRSIEIKPKSLLKLKSKPDFFS